MKLKICGPLTVVVNVFKCLHFNIIAFTSQTYHVICRYFCLRRCDKGDHMRHVMCDFHPTFFYHHLYVTVSTATPRRSFSLHFLVFFHSAAYANPCPSIGQFTLYRRRLCTVPNFNPLNAELNPIRHLLILLGDLTFMGPCIRKYIPIYIQQDAKLHSLFISGNCSACFGWYFHPSSERIQLYLQHLVSVTPLLLSAAIVEELEPV
jgi:hypothetical protein